MQTNNEPDLEDYFPHTQLQTNDRFLYKNGSVKMLDEKLSIILLEVGIVPNVKGYRYLRCAVVLAMMDNEILHNITKKLYPMIATKFDTSSSRVERAIRHAIEIATNSGKMENINSLFGIKIYGRNEKPTNSEFIALIADKLILDYGTAQ